MYKKAKITGATKDPATLSNAALPYSARRAEYVRYLNAKAKESPTKLMNALLGGAALGGLTGGLIGLGGGKQGALVGLFAGALGGSLFGAFAKAIDDGNISEAKRILRRGKIDEDLAGVIVQNQRAKEAFKQYRRQETQSRLRRIERKIDGSRPSTSYRRTVTTTTTYPYRHKTVTVKVGGLGLDSPDKVTQKGMMGNFTRQMASMGLASRAQNKAFRDAQASGRISRMGFLKSGSLCSEIAGTLNQSDFDRFDAVFDDPSARRLIEKNASVLECLHRLTDAPVESAEKLASAAAGAFSQGYDVIQVRPSGYGYTVKVSAAPAGMAPQQAQMTQQQAQQALPPEMLQAADQQGAATVTNVQAEPDPLAEKMAPATGFGMYKVTDAASGKQLVGYVIPGLFDAVTGQPSQMSLFTNGSSYAVQPSISGALLGVNFNLPIPENPDVRGLGVFVKHNEKAIIATVPYNIVTKVTVEGKGYFAAQDLNGNDIRVIPSEGIAKPVATSPTEIVIPSDYKFMPLENPVQLAGGEELMKAAQANAYHTMMELRAWRDGCSLSGPVFEKVGSGEHDWVDGVFWMAAAGVPQNLSAALLEKAASTGEPLRIFGLQPLSTREEFVLEARKEAMAAMADVEIPQRVNLLKEIAAVTFSKEAAALVDTSSVDAVLALNFLNPENVETFVEHLPQLEHASTKLANIVLASQLGLQSIPKTAAVRAMFALEDVISGLKSLKTYSV